MNTGFCAMYLAKLAPACTLSTTRAVIFCQGANRALDVAPAGFWPGKVRRVVFIDRREGRSPR
jgi:hypothetical protein